MRAAPTLQQTDRTYVRWRGRRLSYFGGCDYFRLASHPQVLRAVSEGLRRYGLNVSASRTTTGNHALYERLEKELARFFHAPSAILAPNGYAPSLMAAQALAGRFSHALLDERAHACLVDAAQLLDCPTLRFKHRDAVGLARLVRRLGNMKPLLLTDGMFSHDGSVAPLSEYLAALPSQAMVLVDDAHGAGLLGKSGRGTPELLEVSSPRIIQTVTLSKAFGIFGGAVLCSMDLRAAILSHSRAYVGSTPLPLPLAHAALRSLRLLGSKGPRLKLNRNLNYVRDGLRRAGLSLPATPGPIISLVPPHSASAKLLVKRLLAAGIYPSLIQYSGGPVGGYFRFALSSEHSLKQLDALIQALSRTAKRGK